MKLGYAIPHEIRIKASANMGFITKVGCGVFVSPDEINLLADLKAYLKDPKKWEEEYSKLPGSGVEESGPTPEAPLTPETEQDEARG